MKKSTLLATLLLLVVAVYAQTITHFNDTQIDTANWVKTGTTNSALYGAATVHSLNATNSLQLNGVNAITTDSIAYSYNGVTYTDGLVLYAGFGVALDANQDRYSFYPPKAGTITGYNFFANFSTVGTGESVTLVILINNSAVAASSTTTTFDTSTRRVSVTGFSQAVAATDKIELRITGPTWATEPVARATSVMFNFNY